MQWNGRDTSTIGGLFEAVASVASKEEAARFTAAYLSENEHAVANIGYVIGYGDEETRGRLYDLFGPNHPVFGRC